MKFYVFFILFCVNYVFAVNNFLLNNDEGYALPPPRQWNARAERVDTKYFTQILDHYDSTNTGRWLQRYFVNTEFFNQCETKAVFLMIGGEGQAGIQWMTGGSWYGTARTHKALLFQLEHRYYGQSHPFMNLATANLRYLSSQQALEDIATFIDAMNREYNLSSDVKWILFGGSYSASLAIWARQKYPHLVHGALASSGPIFAKLDFFEYLEVVANGLALTNPNCAATLKNGFVQLENLLADPGTANVTALFNLCFDITDSSNSIEENLSYFYERISSAIAGIVQYHGIPGQTAIGTICNILTNEATGSEVYRVAALMRAFYSTSCLNYRFQALINAMQNTVITASGNSRQWYYQTCTEYGWYQTTNQQDPIFGNRNSVDFYTQICTGVYGTQFNNDYIGDQVDRINRHYGGYDVADVSNVIHVHGSYDPWYPMGLIETENPQSPVIFINGTSHCADLYAASANDPDSLTQAREQIARVIGLWLGVNSAIRIHLSISLILVGLLAKVF